VRFQSPTGLIEKSVLFLHGSHCILPSQVDKLLSKYNIKREMVGNQEYTKLKVEVLVHYEME
jgi:tRNA pseudouridine-54 N-methylase